MRGLADSGSLMLGPALAGLLVVVLGPGGALLVDAGTFLASIACLTLLRRAAAAHTASSQPDFLTGLREAGTRSARAHG